MEYTIYEFYQTVRLITEDKLPDKFIIQKTFNSSSKKNNMLRALCRNIENDIINSHYSFKEWKTWVLDAVLFEEEAAYDFNHIFKQDTKVIKALNKFYNKANLEQQVLQIESLIESEVINGNVSKLYEVDYTGNNILYKYVVDRVINPKIYKLWYNEEFIFTSEFRPSRNLKVFNKRIQILL